MEFKAKDIAGKLESSSDLINGKKLPGVNLNEIRRGLNIIEPVPPFEQVMGGDIRKKGLIQAMPVKAGFEIRSVGGFVSIGETIARGEVTLINYGNVDVNDSKYGPLEDQCRWVMRVKDGQTGKVSDVELRVSKDGHVYQIDGKKKIYLGQLNLVDDNMERVHDFDYRTLDLGKFQEVEAKNADGTVRKCRLFSSEKDAILAKALISTFPDAQKMQEFHDSTIGSDIPHPQVKFGEFEDVAGRNKLERPNIIY